MFHYNFKEFKLRPLMTLWGVRREKSRQIDRGSDIWLCLLTVGLASLKINKFFDDKDPTDSLSPSLSHSLFSTALLSFPLSPSLCPFFTLAVSMGWGRRVSVVCVGGGGREELTATLLHLLSPQLPAFSFIQSALPSMPPIFLCLSPLQKKLNLFLLSQGSPHEELELNKGLTL